jgi:chromosome segregation ATPase
MKTKVLILSLFATLSLFGGDIHKFDNKLNMLKNELKTLEIQRNSMTTNSDESIDYDTNLNTSSKILMTKIEKLEKEIYKVEGEKENYNIELSKNNEINKKIEQNRVSNEEYNKLKLNLDKISILDEDKRESLEKEVSNKMYDDDKASTLFD